MMSSSSKPFEALDTLFARLIRLSRTASVRLTLFYVALFVASVASLFVAVFLITTEELHHQASQEVRREIRDLMDDYNAGGFAELAAVVSRRVQGGTTLQLSYGLVDASGRRVVGSLTQVDGKVGWMEEKVAVLTSPHVPARNRIVSLYAQALQTGGYVLVGFDNNRIREAQEAIATAFALASGAALLLAVGGGLFISFRFLRRIEQISKTTEAIVAGDLECRALVRGTGDEIDHLAIGMNTMLDRIQGLMESMEQVSSDIAHDLRTPLSRLRQRLERAQATAKTTKEYFEAVEQAIADTNSIIQTFSALLSIAQIEAGASRRDPASVDLSELCASIAATYAAVVEGNGQMLVTSIDPSMAVEGDRNLLTQMIANLIENAIRHSPTSAQISIRLGANGSTALLTVADTGPGIPEHERSKVLQRFYRLERSRTTPGNGLGLALVKAVCDFHQATLDLGDNAPGLSVSIALARLVKAPTAT